ncbi:uncharacterized protein LOC121975494 [Zingiber officinale]|uniref:Ternary complex factor MIP1 n=1 Tax=Zingiber officinale TaxID=94328 RepID=A0A8J5GT44_ZINOF|nr:uncharacterized protein LOC121975494 [Zingiber officinale]XP_042383116.1 uncharacterized protein LOC121975494 [Zingiber officinale]XP_042383117.1 uncharacterized protein LOC121975494 [Zingiber officinale]XP_042383118.1 uncharacterized protein LOC121975494 [Zingiber officinale]KAG6511013.1 hypothetical protein ZIOFF_029062 [Zingiber officinale]
MKKRPSLKYMMESSLKTEVQQLEKCLKDQFAVRRALEKALRRNSSSIDESSISYIPKPTKELIMDIAMLELEVVHLERYLLSLYRRAFEEQAPNVPILAVEDEIGQPLVPQSAPFAEVASHDLSFRVAASAAQSGDIKPLRNSSNYLPSEACSVRGQEKNSCRIHRSHSSIVQHTVCSAKGIPCAKNLPLSFFDHEQIINSGVTSLAEHLGTTIAHHIPETPNRLSEDMVRLMCAIYCKLKDHHGRRGISSSPTSSFSSSSSFSPCYTGELRSPCHKRDAMIDAWFGNSRCSERLKELSGPYNMMVEVFSFCKASRKCNDIEEMLQKYKLLVQRIETVDLRSMSNEEKIAFWINIHNSMMMHLYLEHGVPGSNMKKASLVTKNMYNVGGRMVNADIIQGFLLGCRMHPPEQWLTLLSSRVKIKDSDEWKAYAIESPEPLIRFALCSGNHSDPAVRVYNSKRLFQLLQAAKVEYIHATVTIGKGRKLLVPKILEYFGRDSNLSTQELVEMIKCHFPENLRFMVNACQGSSSQKFIEWVPHNFTFRYLLPRDLGNLKSH